MNSRKKKYFQWKPFFVSLSPAIAIALSGCQRAPTVSIVGSFFPAWLICIFIGVIFASVARVVIIRLQWDKDIRPAMLIYPCLAASCALTLWLIFFQ